MKKMGKMMMTMAVMSAMGAGMYMVNKNMKKSKSKNTRNYNSQTNN